MGFDMASHNRLSELTLELTQSCPNLCLFCSSYAKLDTPAKLRLEQITTILTEAKELGIAEVALSGGEPLCHPAWKEVVAFCFEHDLKVALYTTGQQRQFDVDRKENVTTVFTDWAGIIANPDSVDKIRLVFNIQSKNPAEHDELTQQPGSYERSFKSLQAAITAGLCTEVNLVPNLVTSTSLAETIKFFLDAGVKKVHLLRMVEQGYYHDHKEQLALSPDELSALLAPLRDCYENETVRFGIPLSATGAGCTAGTNKLVVRYDGMLLPCEAFKDKADSQKFSFGNIRAGGTLKRAHDEAKTHQLLTELKANCGTCTGMDSCAALKFRENKGSQPKEWILYRRMSKEVEIGSKKQHTYHEESFDALQELVDELGGPIEQNKSTEFPFFVQKKTWERLKKFLEPRPNAAAPDFDPQSDALQTCKQLLLNAIHFLRRSDKRESLYGIEYENDSNLAALHEFGLNELYEYYDEFARSHEGLYYGLEEYYRDHVRHPLYVWLIGMKLLKKLLFESPEASFEFMSAGKDVFSIRPAEDASVDQDKFTIWVSELVAMWTVIAVTHDLGYPFERFEQLNNKGEELFGKIRGLNLSPVNIIFSQQHSFETGHFLEVISSKIVRSSMQKNTILWKTQPRSKYYLKFAKSLACQKHGILSAWLLMWFTPFFTEIYLTKNDANGESDLEEARQFAIRAEILHAIAAHTTDLIYHVSPFTLSFLLILCDELQEWGRPTLQEMKKNRNFGYAEEIVLLEPEFPEAGTSGWVLHARLRYQLSIPPSDKPRGKELRDYHLKFARKKAQGWFKRLRPAIYDARRMMNFKWEMNLIGVNEKIPESQWIFTFDSVTKESGIPVVRLEGPTLFWYNTFFNDETDSSQRENSSKDEFGEVDLFKFD